MATHLCVRVYANGEARYTVRDAAGLESWLTYNRRFRPGNALFVDGCMPDPAKDRGYLNEEQIAHVAETLAAEAPRLEPLTAWQPTYDMAEDASIYPEKGRSGFTWPPAAPARR